MRAALICAVVALPVPAAAQQMDHPQQPMQAEPEPDGMAGHEHDAEPDPHAGHNMGDEQADPHAGHDMGDQQGDPHAGHTMAEPMPPASAASSGPPPEAYSGPEHAADAFFPLDRMTAAREQLRREQGGGVTSLVSVDRLEYQSGGGSESYVWEANGWVGGDLNKLWIKTEGEGEFGESLDDAEVQALYSRAIGPWFDLQTGVRYDYRPSAPDTAHLALGVQGLAPYYFEVDGALFLSDQGDLIARAEAEYDLRITQRLIAQPRVEMNLSAQDIPELGVGSGFTGVDAGLRLRYEIAREFAPYIGVEYQTDLGRTRELVRQAGDDPDRTAFVAGVKFWF